jgi:hypothetical protein
VKLILDLKRCCWLKTLAPIATISFYPELVSGSLDNDLTVEQILKRVQDKRFSEKREIAP